MYKAFDAETDEPTHTREHNPFHAPFVHVMETLGEPLTPLFQYAPGQFVYVHDKAYETNPLAARECCIQDVTGAPLEIVVYPCNRPDQAFTVAQDKLSAPIMV